MKTRMRHSVAPPERRFSRPRSPAFRHAAFTLAELLVGISLTAVLLAGALGGVVAIQKSYSATENYGTGLADQMRLLDYLAQDLRRAVAPATGAEPWTADADGQGIKISLPDYYRFNASDTQHLFPIANDAVLDPLTGMAFYSSAAAGGAGVSANSAIYQTIAYRYANGVITRTDPWQPLVAADKGGFKAAAPLTVATSMDAFPKIEVDKTISTNGGVLRYKISFYSTFQPLAVPNSSNTITLHNVTFVRSKNLSR